MSFEPRGKVAVLLEAMRAQPEKNVWSADDVAQTMEVPKGNLPAYLRASLSHGLLHGKVTNGRSFFSLEQFAPDWTPPALPFSPAKMEPPRGVTGQVPRAPLPAPLPAAAPPAPIKTRPPTPPAADAPGEHLAVEPVAEEAATEQEQVEEEPFDACQWVSGDLDLYGLVELENGAQRITAANVLKLRKLLAWMPC